MSGAAVCAAALVTQAATEMPSSTVLHDTTMSFFRSDIIAGF
jgi:hypothetical protein